MEASAPFEGLARLISAMTDTVGPDFRTGMASRAALRDKAFFSSSAREIVSCRLAASSKEPAYKDSSNYCLDFDPPTPKPAFLRYRPTTRPIAAKPTEA